jgi:hypothetical protein
MAHAQLHSTPGSPQLGNGDDASLASGEWREEVWSGSAEDVQVEMGGGMGDLAVLLRTIDFAAQVSDYYSHCWWRVKGEIQLGGQCGCELIAETFVSKTERSRPDALVSRLTGFTFAIWWKVETHG